MERNRFISRYWLTLAIALVFAASLCILTPATAFSEILPGDTIFGEDPITGDPIYGWDLYGEPIYGYDSITGEPVIGYTRFGEPIYGTLSDPEPTPPTGDVLGGPPDYLDHDVNKGHGNDPDRFDEDNPGNSSDDYVVESSDVGDDDGNNGHGNSGGHDDSNPGRGQGNGKGD